MPENSSNNSTAGGGTPITLLPTQPIAYFVPNLDKWELWHERLEIYLCEIDYTNDNIKKYIEAKNVFTKSQINHLVSVCRSKKNENYVLENSDLFKLDNSYNFSILSVENGNWMNLYTLPVMINGYHLKAICDTGASCKLLSKSFLQKIKVNENDIRPCKTSYKVIAATIFQFLVSLTKSIVIVTNTENPPLLGSTFLRAFNFELKEVNTILEKRDLSVVCEETKDEFSDVFNDGLGAYKCAKFSLSRNETARPIFF
ncbi:hypothetical protein CVS40_12677 [Lucilia cuprina]|nr:hypothetical protein CVS40_12677 [Lucilia cuprina]